MGINILCGKIRWHNEQLKVTIINLKVTSLESQNYRKAGLICKIFADFTMMVMAP